MIFYVIASLVYGFVIGAMWVALVAIDAAKSRTGEKSSVGVLASFFLLSCFWPITIPIGMLFS